MNKGAKKLAEKTKAAINTANSNPTPANEAKASKLTQANLTVRENRRQNQRARNGF